MTKCENCRKKVGVTGIKCKFCNMNLCTACLQLEIHHCKNIQQSVKQKKDQIEKSLKKNNDPTKFSVEYDCGNAY